MVDPETGQMTPRKCDLRAFVVTGKNTHVWYSGLTRYSSIPGQMIVNSSQGGGFKGHLVLAKETGVEHDYAPGSEVVRVLEQSPQARWHSSPRRRPTTLFWLFRGFRRVHPQLPVRREESGFRTQRHRLRVQQRGDSAPRTCPPARCSRWSWP